MKRFNHLYSEIIERSNLERALVNAMKGKSHYNEVKLLKIRSSDSISELHEMLRNETFVNSRYHIFTKRATNKERVIHKLPLYPDRVIHHAIVQVLMPVWLKILIRDTYSTIPGRGIHDGVKRMKTALKDDLNTVYALKFDIRKYYQSINHDVLLSILRRKIKDEKLMRLLEIIIRSAPGIPIGNYISQWFGNMYLAYFDHYCKEQLNTRYYFRYCDDVVILGRTKDELHARFIKIRQYLHDYLMLEIKDNYQVFPVNKRGIDFLGYKFYHTHVLVRKRIVKNFIQKRRQTKVSRQKLQGQLASYNGWFKYANTYRLLNKYPIYE